MGIFNHHKSNNPIEGLIGFYDLTYWWIFEFTEEERQYIVDRFRLMETPPDNKMLIRGRIIRNKDTMPVTTFLAGLAGWFTSKEDAHIAQRMYRKIKELGGFNPTNEPGNYRGRHYTTYLDEIKELKKSNSTDELERLLLCLIDAVEAEAAAFGGGIPYGYSKQLAILYRKQKEYLKEIKILSRYIWATQQTENHVIGAGMVERLEKAKLLHEKAAKMQT